MLNLNNVPQDDNPQNQEFTLIPKGAVVRAIVLVQPGDMEIPEFAGVSEQGKMMIQQLLTIDPNRRMSSDEALAHPWITMHEKADSNKEATALALVNLQQYNTQ